MSDNSARLVATLEARVNRFEKDLARANGTARREFGDIERRGRQMADRLEESVTSASARMNQRLKGISAGFNAATASLKAGLAGFAAGAASQLTLGNVQSSIADLAKLNDVAERTGASAAFLQEFAYAVRQSGGEAADAAAGIQKFAVNVSKAAAGGGDLAEVFEANGVAIADATGKMRPIEDLLRDFADLVKNAGSEQDQLNLATMAFGRSAGPALVLALAGGRQGLDDLFASARKTGSVLGDDLVKKAAALDDQFAELEDTINGMGKKIAVEFAGPVVASALEAMLDKLRELRSVLDAIRSMDLGTIGEFLLSRTGPGALYNALKSEAGDERGRLEAQRADLQARIASLQAVAHAAPGAADAAKTQMDKLKADLADVEARIKRINATPVSVDYTPSRAGYTAGAPRTTVVPGEGGGKDDPFASGDAIRDYVRQVVKAESGGNASAKNPNSSATGAGQFIESTWLALFRKHYPEAAAKMGRDAILDLRKDADISKQLIEEYAKENAASLRNAGQAVTSANLHLAHFLGPQGAIATLRAPAGAPTSSFLGDDQIAANTSILQGKTREDVLGYADRRANDTRIAAKDFTPEEEAAQKKIDAINRVVEALTRESEAVGKTNEQERLRQALQDAGVDADSLEGQQIAAKVQQLYALKAAQEATAVSARDLKEAQREFADIGADAVKGFVDDLKSGASAADALRNALDRMISRLTDKLIDNVFDSLLSIGTGGGGGGFLGLFSGLFGGARAKGGPVRKGVPYVVGERRAELFVPEASGRILPRVPAPPQMSGYATPMARQAQAAGGKMRHESRINIDLTGANGDKTIREISGRAAAEGSRRAYRQAMADVPTREAKLRRHGH